MINNNENETMNLFHFQSAYKMIDDFSQCSWNVRRAPAWDDDKSYGSFMIFYWISISFRVLLLPVWLHSVLKVDQPFIWSHSSSNEIPTKQKNISYSIINQISASSQSDLSVLWELITALFSASFESLIYTHMCCRAVLYDNSYLLQE